MYSGLWGEYRYGVGEKSAMKRHAIELGIERRLKV